MRKRHGKFCPPFMVLWCAVTVLAALVVVVKAGLAFFFLIGSGLAAFAVHKVRSRALLSASAAGNPATNIDTLAPAHSVPMEAPMKTDRDLDRTRRPRNRKHPGAMPLVLTVLVVVLIISGLKGRSWLPTRARRAPPPTGATQTPLEQKPIWTEKGIGETREQAMQIALERAHEKVIAYLHEQNSLQWTPSLDYLRQKLVKNVKDEIPTYPDEGLKHQVNLRVEVGPEEQKDILREERNYRVELRLTGLARVLGVLVALLATVAVYVRLDELSKGYYTAWLRLAAVTVVAAGGGVCYWVFGIN